MPQAVQWNANRRRFMKAVLVQRFWLPFERACLLSPKPGRTSDTMALHGKALSCRSSGFVLKPAVNHAP